MIKTSPLTLVVCLLLFNITYAQQEKGIIGSENWLRYWTEFRPAQNEYEEPTQILTGTISDDITLNKRETYLLLGDVFVTDSTTLTIESGTVILADHKSKASLTIAKGATIIAQGTQTDPIVFTSNRDLPKKGDWGGLFILGNAPVNKIGDQWSLNYGLSTTSPKSILYGGDEPESSSGILKYVRIEYAGKRTRDYGYYNSLTLAGIGNNTLIENVMVSYSAGNSFYVEGGNVQLSKLVSYRSSQNDFKFDYGAQSTIQNSIAVRSPYVSGPGGASSMYVSSYSDFSQIDITKKHTLVDARNLTLLNLSEDINADINVGLVKEALYIAKDASLSMDQSVLSGFNPAVILDEQIKVNNDNLQKIKFTRMYFNNSRGNIYTENVSNNEDLENWYGNSSFQNVYSKGSDSETFIDPNNIKDPDFRLRINKIIALNDPEQE
tara:strand:+ start:96807 stop:98117 length:1311 start_codon:yes stop_codon:yes gene_type:complete